MHTVRVGKVRDVGLVIKTVRESRGVTQQDLAESLAFSRDYLIDLENGRSNLYVTRLFRTLNELGVTVALQYEATDGDA
ncbi:MAG: hypothetical protein RI885_1705 [Actinomycetota bacterium]|jgi:HTH-type transcriptional regulator/antitoxin HipB